MREALIGLLLWVLSVAIGLAWVNERLPGLWPSWLGPEERTLERHIIHAAARDPNKHKPPVSGVPLDLHLHG